MLTKPEVLLIGGPANCKQTEDADPPIERIGCDCLSILTAGSLSDFRFIVFWPDESLFDLGSQASWKAAIEKDPTLEVPDRSYWNHLSRLKHRPTLDRNHYEQALNEARSQRVMPPDFRSRRRLLFQRVSTSLEAQDLSRVIRCMVSMRLHDIITAATRGATVCVLLSGETSPDDFNNLGALDWLTPVLSVRTSSAGQRAKNWEQHRCEGRVFLFLNSLCAAALETDHFVFKRFTEDEDGRLSTLPVHANWAEIAMQQNQEKGDCNGFDAEYFARWPGSSIEYKLISFEDMGGSAIGIAFQTGKGSILCTTAPSTLQQVITLWSQAERNPVANENNPHTFTTPDNWRTIFRHNELFNRFPRPDTIAQKVLRLLEKKAPAALPLEDVARATGLNSDRPQDAFKGRLKELYGRNGIIEVLDANDGKSPIAQKSIRMKDPH